MVLSGTLLDQAIQRLCNSLKTRQVMTVLSDTLLDQAVQRLRNSLKTWQLAALRLWLYLFDCRSLDIVRCSLLGLCGGHSS